MRCFPVTVLIASLAIVAWLCPAVTALLELDFAAVAGGQWWRLLGGHVTHFGAEHLFWDLLMFVVLGAACERKHPRAFGIALGGLMLGTSIAIGVWCPAISSYRGLSGLDTALFVWFLADQIVASAQRTRWKAAMLWATPLVGLVAKLVFEAATGQTLFVDSAAFQPLVEAHLAGVVGGLVCVTVFRTQRSRDDGPAAADRTTAENEPAGSPQRRPLGQSVGRVFPATARRLRLRPDPIRGGHSTPGSLPPQPCRPDRREAAT